MDTNYLIGTIFNRMVGVVTIIFLSHLLSGRDFGIFIIASTGVMFANIIAGWWMHSVAYRFGSGADRSIVDDTLSVLLSAAIVTMLLLAFTTTVAAIWYGGLSLQAGLLIASWAILLLFNDLTLAVNNALGQPRAYASLSVARNVFVLMATLGFVHLGWGSLGAMAGQAFGAALALAAVKGARDVWRRARPGLKRLAEVGAMVRFGIAGAFANGVYMLVQAPGRAIVEANSGTEAAGQYALALDLFMAPMILIGVSFSLSRIRAMYQSDTLEDAQNGQRESGHQFEVFALLVLPYVLVGSVVASSFVGFIIGKDMAEGVAAVAQAAIVQSGILLMLAAWVVATLVADRKKRVIAMVAGIASANAIVLWWLGSSSLVTAAWGAAGCMFVVLALGLMRDVATDRLQIRGRWLLAVAASAVPAWGFAWFCDGFLLSNPFTSSIVGTLVFAGTTQLAGLVDWRVFLKTRGMAFVPVPVVMHA